MILTADHSDPGLDGLYDALGPLVPPRGDRLNVQVYESEDYRTATTMLVSEQGLPDWADEFRKEASLEYGQAKKNARKGRLFTWPDRLEQWELSDVDSWWEHPESGVRGLGVHIKDLLVQDLKARHTAPLYQPTNSWTRGVQVFM